MRLLRLLARAVGVVTVLLGAEAFVERVWALLGGLMR